MVGLEPTSDYYGRSNLTEMYISAFPSFRGMGIDYATQTGTCMKNFPLLYTTMTAILLSMISLG